MSPDPRDLPHDPRYYRDGAREWGQPDDPGTAWREKRAEARKNHYERFQSRLDWWLWAAVAAAWVVAGIWLLVKYGAHHG